MIKKERYGALDGLRAYAAIGILIMHVLANGNYTCTGVLMESVIPSWASYVFLFMMVSAFSLCCGYFEKFQNNQIDYKEFYKKRYSKIWPLFALLCLIDIVISPGKESFYELFANLTLCFGFLPNHDISVIGVGWFLGVVFIFYMIFPFFCSLISTKKSAWGAFIVACVLNVLCIVYFFDEAHVISTFVGKHNFVYCAVYFIAGGLLYLYRKELGTASKRYQWIVLAACIVATIFLIFFGPKMPVVLITFALYIVYAIGSQGGVLENRFTKFISGISLEIYLCHMPIFRVLEKLKFTQLFGDSIWSFLMMSAGTLVGTVAFALVVQKVIDLVKKRAIMLRTKCSERDIGRNISQ